MNHPERDLGSIFGLSSDEPIRALVSDIVDDPTTSAWPSLALQDAMARDPLDAANDAETLERVLNMRAELALRSGNGMRRL